MLAILWAYLLPGIGVLLVVAAAAAFIYIPLVGHWLAAALLVLAAGVFAFDAGYTTRGNLDQSALLKQDIAQLKANEVELQREADAAKTIAADATAAQRVAESSAAADQAKVDSYVATLKQNPPCGFTPDDVERLLNIGGAGGPTS